MTDASSFVPVNTPRLDGNEAAYLAECIESGWISSEGPFVERFESAFAERMNGRSCVVVNSGTDALELAVKALGIGPGDEVILPSFTIMSCASAVIRCGARPIFVDADPSTWNMSIDQVEACISDRTRAVMAVHIYGLPVDMDPLIELARKHNFLIIEDAAQAIGQTYKDRPCGTLGDIAAFSFYPNKLVTTGEGGMVVCRDPELAAKCAWYRNLCFEKPRFVHRELVFRIN